MKIGVIGGGILGLTAAYYLSKRGHKVTLFEKDKEIGGLASSIKIGNSYLERYYHHFFLGDKSLVNLLEELNLKSKIICNNTPMGVYYKGRIYPFGTPKELLRFKPFNIFEKIKFGCLIMYMTYLNNWRKLEGVGMKDWLLKNVGKKNYEIIWKPLLEAKFGKKAEEISASWLWGRIHPRAKSRSQLMSKETLCYLNGSFQIVIDKLREEILLNRGKIIVGKPVKKIVIRKNKAENIICGKKKFKFDKIISTIPSQIFIEITPGLAKEYHEHLKKIGYQGVVCLMLTTKKSLGKIYWINICDSKIPLTVIVEHTNFIPKNKYGGKNIIYLSNYVSKDDPIYKMNDSELVELYLRGLKKVYSNFNEKDIIATYLSKTEFATPIYIKNYSKFVPNFKTPANNLYLVNTTQRYPEDRNVSNSVYLGKKISEIIE